MEVLGWMVLVGLAGSGCFLRVVCLSGAVLCFQKVRVWVLRGVVGLGWGGLWVGIDRGRESVVGSGGVSGVLDLKKKVLTAAGFGLGRWAVAKVALRMASTRCSMEGAEVILRSGEDGGRPAPFCFFLVLVKCIPSTFLSHREIKC